MLFRQIFDEVTYTYTYLIADVEGGKAVLIDPVIEQLSQYKKLISNFELTLVATIEIHVHADHITAAGLLRNEYGCDVILGEAAGVKCDYRSVTDGELISIGDLSIKVLYTPGHTDDSYCFMLEVRGQKYLFSGDTLFVRGTERTDFQHGDSAQLYDNIVNTLFALGDDTFVYPSHDYNGMTMTTIGEERRFNPRLAGKSVDEFVDIMASLNLPNPKQLEIAVPANLELGLI